MSRISFFLAGVLIGGAAVLTTLKYHVVRAEDGFHLIPKSSARFGEAYVDIREFGLSDWNNHRSLAAAIMDADKGYLLKDAAIGGLRGSVDRMWDAITGPAP